MLSFYRPVFFRRLAVLGMVFGVTGCSYLVTSATEELGRNLTKVILNHSDPATVAQAIPSYLLLLETLDELNAGQPALLASISTLYGAYTTLIPEDPKRSQLLANKALDYALRSVCSQHQRFCRINQLKFPEFKKIISQCNVEHVPLLYTVGSAWAGWIQAHRADWNAVAQLAQVKTIMQFIVANDETYKQGSAHVYLGVMATLVPPALGGDPQIAKQHFERALKLSQQRNLMVKVLYAKQYARLLFNRQLHDRLLAEVLAADPSQPEMTLSNIIAQQQAQKLIDSANDYF